MGPKEIVAIAENGVWRFEAGAIWDEVSSTELFTDELHERWTFADFLPGGELALAHESRFGEPESMGMAYGGVQIRTLTDGAWSLVAFEYFEREVFEDFVPQAVCWHPRGVLAWVIEDLLYVQMRGEPRGIISEPIHQPPEPDSAGGLAYFFETFLLHGEEKPRLSLNTTGRYLDCVQGSSRQSYDLEELRERVAGGDWRAIPDWRISR